MNVPNNLTFLRISLIPFFVLVYYLPWQWSSLVSTIIFFIACITDWLDGYLARKLSQQSAFGEFLDPVADKLIVVTALILLVQTHGTAWLAIPAVLIISREIIISALREWMASLGNRTKVAVSYIGKVKTMVQMTAIALLLFFPKQDRYWICISYALLHVAAGLTLWSMILYLKSSWKMVKSNKVT